jgi:hypothetical protein
MGKTPLTAAERRLACPTPVNRAEILRARARAKIHIEAFRGSTSLATAPIVVLALDVLNLSTALLKERNHRCGP